MEAKSGWIGRK